MTDIARQQNVTAIHFSQNEQAATDPVGMWYIARERFGIGDNNWYGFATRDFAGADTIYWITVPHREADGIGALTRLLHARGYAGGRTPTGRDTSPPSLGEIFKGWRESRAANEITRSSPQKIQWRYLNPKRAQEAHDTPPQSVFFSDAEYAQLRQAARAAGCSTTNWLMWTLDRALRQTLVEPTSHLRWVFPVNLRGAVQTPAPHMNQCSGLTLTLTEDNTPATIAEQLRTRFALHEHWRSWLLLNLGQWIGQTGVHLAYRFARENPGSWAGSYSNLGAWPLPGMTPPSTNPGGQLSGALCASPGSPAYPVSTGIVDWQGRLALACRVHPVADADGNSAAQLLRVWHSLACGR